jgi:hypothetical protein
LLEDTYLVVFKAELGFKLDGWTGLSVTVCFVFECSSKKQVGYVKL